MKAELPLLCIALAACDNNTSARPLNGSISSALKPGMTEQQVAVVSDNRVPDRVVIRTCGTETRAPFACKVFVYGAPSYRCFRGCQRQWVVNQWL
jgi:hypothetical protein